MAARCRRVQPSIRRIVHEKNGGERELAGAVAPPGRTRIPLNLAPGQHVRAAFRATLPHLAPSGAADVWRIVEHTAGQITGGVTIVVRAK